LSPFVFEVEPAMRTGHNHQPEVPMTMHKVGTREEHLAARLALLEAEKELTRHGDELGRRRRELPWVPVEKQYTFDTDDGPKSLRELFDGRSQLLVYHFMFGPKWTEGCPLCSYWADSFNGAIVHLKHRDVTMVCASSAPGAQLDAYKRRMGWSFPWASSGRSDFNYDFGVSVRGLDAGHSQPEMERLTSDRTAEATVSADRKHPLAAATSPRPIGPRSIAHLYGLPRRRPRRSSNIPSIGRSIGCVYGAA
jgi:predicted dithiol-disulfide oxidoreductase (DUF899 family)